MSSLIAVSYKMASWTGALEVDNEIMKIDNALAIYPGGTNLDGAQSYGNPTPYFTLTTTH